MAGINRTKRKSPVRDDRKHVIKTPRPGYLIAASVGLFQRLNFNGATRAIVCVCQAKVQI